MALDPRIALQTQGIQLADPMDMAAKSMSMREMAARHQDAERKREEETTMRDIYRKNVKTDESGRTSLDRQGVMSDMYKARPDKALDLEQIFRGQDLEKMKFDTSLSKQAAWSIQDGDAAGYAAAREALIKQGVANADKLPPQYNPEFVKNWQLATLEGEKQIEQRWKAQDQQNKEREFGLQERKVKADEAKTKAETTKLYAETGRKDRTGENLPLDAKKTVETLASKNAGKVAIKNQIDAVMTNWESLSDDQKVAAGRQLLKTLNSTEGADAIGAEEAKRLGSKLEFAVGNLTNSNPIQFGRDLPGFAEQARNTSAAIGRAVDRNQAEIDRTMGRRPVARFEQDVLSYAEKHGISPEQAQAIKDQRTGSRTAGR